MRIFRVRSRESKCLISIFLIHSRRSFNIGAIHCVEEFLSGNKTMLRRNEYITLRCDSLASGIHFPE
jgi:hypothetical protein